MTLIQLCESIPMDSNRFLYHYQKSNVSPRALHRPNFALPEWGYIYKKTSIFNLNRIISHSKLFIYPLTLLSTLISNLKADTCFCVFCPSFVSCENSGTPYTYWHCPHNMRSKVFMKRSSVRPSVCPIVRAQQRRVCCWAPCGKKMSIDSGEPSSNGAAARGRSTALSSKSGQCRVDRRVDEA